MSEVRAIAIETEIAIEVWATMKSPRYGHPASTSVAKGHGPCRHCLRPFRIGEESRTLFTYNPFREDGMIPLPGPVFIHAEECKRFGAGGYPPELTPFPVVLDAYNQDQRAVSQMRAMEGGQEAAIVAMFADEAVRYVMVRDLKAGCFDFRVERRDEKN
jgi:hypothetical protein